MRESAAQVKARLDAYRDEKYPGWRSVSVGSVLDVFSDGDGIGWANEFNRLEDLHWSQIAALEKSVRTEGMREPIVLGSDGRVWDGHHRLLVASRIGYGKIPVVFAGQTSPNIRPAGERE